MDREGNRFGIEAVEVDIGGGQSITIGLFRPQDAPGVAALFRDVYGDGYPVKRFYDPEAMVEAHETGDNYSLTARRGDGTVVGHMALFRSAPHPGLYECGAGLVLPEYRSAGLSRMLLTELYERVAPGLGVDGVWGEAVCNHTIIQKAVSLFRNVETGLEVDLMPAEAYEQEQSAPGRVASLVCFRDYRPRHHTVYLPPSHEAPLRYVYQVLEEGRTLEISREPLPPQASSRATTRTFAFARVSRIEVTAVGGDFDACMEELEQELLAQPTWVIQAHLSLACPSVGEAAQALSRRGYFLGGVLPRWFDDDALLMQKIYGSPDWDGIRLFSDRAREILRLVRADWERVRKGQ